MATRASVSGFAPTESYLSLTFRGGE
ncbi:hypothetical protein FRAHR75_10249 [Frankia sp. Hr75.2]|nr:hypothetical protein FRAHR75_10249 [Frankia sp. Hr75.2]